MQHHVRVLGIIRRFATIPSDTISPALRRKRSPVLPDDGDLFTPSDPRDPFPSASTSRVRDVNKSSRFSPGRDIRLRNVVFLATLYECIIKRYFPPACSPNNFSENHIERELQRKVDLVAPSLFLSLSLDRYIYMYLLSQ